MKHEFKLKTISRESIAEALLKAERYRLLNEPMQSESICKDILETDPGNQQALIMMLLAITDQFGKHAGVHENKARELVKQLTNAYDRHYYSGIISERKGFAILSQGMIGNTFNAYEWLSDAMADFEKAEAIRPAGNDDAILRWNTCARQIMGHRLEARQDHDNEPPLE